MVINQYGKMELSLQKDYLNFGVEGGYTSIDEAHIKSETIYKGKKGNKKAHHIEYIFLETDNEWDGIIGYRMGKKDLLHIITSEKFLKAITKSYWKKTKFTDRKIYYKNEVEGYKKFNNRFFKIEKDLYDYITMQQAIAIRDGELDLFIIKLGIGQNTKN